MQSDNTAKPADDSIPAGDTSSASITFRYKIHSAAVYTIPATADNDTFIQTITDNPYSLEVIPPIPVKPYFDFDLIVHSDHATISARQQHYSKCISAIQKLFPNSIIHALESSRPLSNGQYKFSFHFILDQPLILPTALKQLLTYNNIEIFDKSVYHQREAYFRAPYCSKEGKYPLRYILPDFTPIDIDKLSTYNIKYTDLLVTPVNQGAPQYTSQPRNDYITLVDDLPRIQSTATGPSCNTPDISTIPFDKSSDTNKRLLDAAIAAYIQLEPNATCPKVCTSAECPYTDLITFNNRDPCAMCHRTHRSNRTYIVINYSKKIARYYCNSRKADGLDDYIQLDISAVQKDPIPTADSIQPTYYEDAFIFSNSNPTVNNVKLFMLGYIFLIVDGKSFYFLIRTRKGYTRLGPNMSMFSRGIDSDLATEVSGKRVTFHSIFNQLMKEPIFRDNCMFADVNFIPFPPYSSITHITDEEGCKTFNTWRGFTHEKYAGKHDQEGLDFILSFIYSLCNHDDTIYDYVIKWIANILQHPREKQTVLVFISEQGVGKGRLFAMLEKIIGHCILIENTANLFGDFNSLTVNKLLVAIDEAQNGSRMDHNRFKHLITEDTIAVNEKHKVQYTTNNFSKYMMFSNDPNCIKIEPGCRRFVIINSASTNIGDVAYFRRLSKLIDNIDSMNTLFKYLLTINLTDFAANIPIKTEVGISTAIRSLSSADHFLLNLAIRQRENNIPYEYFKPADLYAKYVDYANQEGIPSHSRIDQKNLSSHVSNVYNMPNKPVRDGDYVGRHHTIRGEYIGSIITKRIGSSKSIFELV